MKPLSEIRRESDEAARVAAKKKMIPYIPFSKSEVLAWKSFPFPYLGSYIPKGWIKVDELFADHSGWGSPTEAALTPQQLKNKIIQLLDDTRILGFGITEVGQFQLYVGVYEKITKHRSK